MQDRFIGWMAVAVVASFVAQFTVGVVSPDDPLSRSFVLGTLNALAWYGMTALAAVWLLRGSDRRIPALGIIAGQGVLALPGILLVLSGDYGSLPVWLVVSLVGDAVIVVAGALAVHSLANGDRTEWRLWTWPLTRALILGATALLALSKRMPRFVAPSGSPLLALDTSLLTRIVTGPLPWRMMEVGGLIAVLAVGFAAATLRPRRLAVAIGATVAVPAVPELLSLVIDPARPAAASGSPTGWLWAQTAAVIVLALGLVFLATAGGRADGTETPLIPKR